MTDRVACPNGHADDSIDQIGRAYARGLHSAGNYPGAGVSTDKYAVKLSFWGEPSEAELIPAFRRLELAWNSLYYCYLCDRMFDPQTGEFFNHGDKQITQRLVDRDPDPARARKAMEGRGLPYTGFGCLLPIALVVAMFGAIGVLPGG